MKPENEYIISDNPDAQIDRADIEKKLGRLTAYINVVQMRLKSLKRNLNNYRDPSDKDIIDRGVKALIKSKETQGSLKELSK